MPRTKQRLSTSTNVPKGAIEKVGLQLQELPEKPKETWSLREAVFLLYEPITAALNRGYNHDEIVALLSEKNIDITTSSLKRYLATARRDKETTAKPKAKRTRRATADKTATPVSTPAQPKAAKTTKASSSRKRQTASESSPSATVKPPSTRSKVAAKAKPKPTTRAKTTTRSSSTRSRKKTV
jgi:hypothetical protein